MPIFGVSGGLTAIGPIILVVFGGRAPTYFLAAISVFFTTLVGTLVQTCRMEELVSKHAAIMDKYDPEKKVGMIVDEWGTWYDGNMRGLLQQQNTLRDAIVAGINLNMPLIGRFLRKGGAFFIRRSLRGNASTTEAQRAQRPSLTALALSSVGSPFAFLAR